jgi:hypothetical protein
MVELNAELDTAYKVECNYSEELFDVRAMSKRYISDTVSYARPPSIFPLLLFQVQLKFNCYLPEVCSQQLTP